MSKGARTLSTFIKMDISDFQKKLNTVQRNIRKVGQSMQKVGSTMTKGLTAPIIAGAVAIGMVVNKAVNASEELVRLSDVTGISVEELQRMKYVGSQLGVELETMTSAHTKLTRSIAEASGGNKEAIQAFEGLGISIYDANGKLKEAPEIFNEVIDKLGSIEDPVTRDALAMQLMGKSAQDLNPLIKAGADEIERLKQRATELGLVLSEEQVTALEKFGDGMDTVSTKLQVAGAQIAVALLPFLERLLEVVNELLPPVLSFLKGMAEGFEKLPKPVQDFILVMVAILAVLGPVFMAIGWIISVLAPLIAWMKVTAFTVTILGGTFAVSFGWIVLAVIAVIAIIATLWMNWKSISKWMGDAFKTMGDVVGVVWNTIVDGIEMGINNIIGMINLLIKGINLIPGVKFPLIPKVDFNGNGKDLFGNFNSEKNQTTNVNVNLDGRKISSYTDNSIGGRAISQGGAF
jgi:phage-related minor tail protein